MTDTYTFRLLSIECIQAQELDGDEIYVTLDNTTIWDALPYKMIQTPSHTNHISAFDFANARKHTRAGWEIEPVFEPEMLIFTDLSGTKHLKIWDADRFSANDLLGDSPVSLKDAGRGNIMIVCSRDGAVYHLVYRVDAE